MEINIVKYEVDSAQIKFAPFTGEYVPHISFILKILKRLEGKIVQAIVTRKGF